MASVDGPTMDGELLDQGNKTKLMHVPDGIGSPGLTVPGGDPNDKGVMEMRDGRNVPGAAGQGACTEAVDDLNGKFCGRRWACRRGIWGDRAPGAHSPNCS